MAAIPVTKLQAPRAAARPVDRARLISEAEREKKTVWLLQAPAGFGKTSLLVQWQDHLKASGVHTVWVSLDAGDDSVPQFARLIVRALSDGARDFYSAWEGIFQLTPKPEPSAIFAPVVDWLSTVETPIALLLDDFHAITDPEAHRLLSWLVQHAPPRLSFIVATRSEPLLSLSRLRAYGYVGQLGAKELSFSPAETEAFLADCGNGQLDAAQVSRIHTRTEGWAAGLRLAAISLASGDDPEAAIARLTGRNFQVSDYLMENVLSLLPTRLGDFLLKTSVLDQFDASLCRAVTGDPDCQELLEHLDRSNVLIYRLDSEKRWFRYHDLFSQFLREKLERSNAMAADVVRRAASGWYEAQGQLARAIDYALAAGDYARAAGLIEGIGWDYIRRAQFSQLRDWIDRFPPNELRQSYRLILMHAWSGLYGIHDPALESTLARVEAELADQEVNSGDEASRTEVRRLRAEAQVVSCALDVVKRDQPNIQRYSLELSREIRPDDTVMKCLDAFYSSFYFSAQGRLDLARAALERSIDLAVTGDIAYIQINGRICLGYIHFLQGNWDTAQDIYEKLLYASADQGWEDHVLAGSCRVRYAQLVCQQDQLDDARLLLSRAVETLKANGSGSLYCVALVERARLYVAQLNFGAAQADLDAAKAGAGKLGIERVLIWAKLIEVRIAVCRRDFVSAQRILADLDAEVRTAVSHPSADTVLAEFEEQYLLASAVLLIAQDDYAAAQRLAGRVWKSARTCGRFMTQVRSQLLRAICCWMKGENGAAMAKLASAVDRAERLRWSRLFSDTEAMLPALAKMLFALRARWVSEGRGPASLAFLQSLLPAEPGLAREQKSGPARSGDLLEPMTDRELQLVRLLSLGLSNREIGDRVALSPETVKWHLKNLYSKMGAHNRIEAISRGRELGLCS